jgi:hypothetical protein
MTALTADNLLDRRGEEPVRNRFGYSVAAGEIVWRGSLIALNSAGNVVRVQTSGALVFLGVCNKQVDNRNGSAVSTSRVEGQKGTWGITVPSATFSNTGATVFAVDDGTVSLTNSGSLLTVGTLAGTDIGTGRTYVSIAGS